MTTTSIIIIIIIIIITKSNPGLAQNFGPTVLKPDLYSLLHLNCKDRALRPAEFKPHFLFNPGLVSPFEHLGLDDSRSALVDLCIIR